MDLFDAKKMYSLPVGVQNYLPDECYNKVRIEKILTDEFSLWGYNRIEIAPLEFFDNFQVGTSKIDQKRMIKFSDTDGNLVVLTPDITLPIARLAVKKFYDELPIKLCYTGNVFENTMDTHTRSRVQAQAGVEFMGCAGIDADIEVITLAIESLKKIGLRDFKIDIGQVDFFKGIIEEYNIGDLAAEEIRQFIDKKNMLSVKRLISELGISDNAYAAINAISTLFGGAEVIEKARRIVENKTSNKALDDLQLIFDKLKNFGLSEYISIDLSQVQRINYYSGIIFRCLSKYIGAPIMTGGRYDSVSKAFGKEIAGAGFAIDVKKALIALEAQCDLKKFPKIEVVLCSDGDDKYTYDYVKYLRNEGKRAVQVYGKGEKECTSYAKSIGADCVILISRRNDIKKVEI